jgi:Protein of unknown function, DUF481
MQSSNDQNYGSLRDRSAWLLVLLLIVFCSERCFARQRKDVLQFTNGDRITCEIMRLDKGMLFVRLPYARGEVGFDWSQIAQVESAEMFVVADKTGKRYTGTLRKVTITNLPEESAEMKVQVVGSSASQLVRGKDVVEIERTDTSFWQNLHGDLNGGLNYSKQQNRTQFNFQSNTLFQRTKWSMAANYQTSFSGGGDLSNLRNDVQLNGTRQLRSPRNFYMGLAEFLQSNEQQLNLRMTLGGAVGRVFSQTRNSFVNGYAGVIYNREQYSSEATVGRTGDSAEAVFGTQMNFFRFRATDIVTTAQFYPSLTDPGRVRFDLNTSMKLRVAKRLDWTFGFFVDFDSRPPQNLPKSDFGSTSGLSWRY